MAFQPMPDLPISPRCSIDPPMRTDLLQIRAVQCLVTILVLPSYLIRRIRRGNSGLFFSTTAFCSFSLSIGQQRLENYIKGLWICISKWKPCISIDIRLGFPPLQFADHTICARHGAHLTATIEDIACNPDSLTSFALFPSETTILYRLGI